MILVGCEESQTICGIFRKYGFEAYSCDLQETRGNPAWHIHGDVKDAIRSRRWDMIILHPECTYMAVCANKYYAERTQGYKKRLDAVEWTIDLWNLAKMHSDHVALENPASVIFPHLRKLGADVQYIQPHDHGHLEQKKTGFALHGLPRLTKTNDVYDEMMKLPKCKRERIHYMSPGETRTRDRSETYAGIAEAIAQQWLPVVMRNEM